MATGDASNAAMVANGYAFTADFEGINPANINGFEADKIVTVSGTSEGYDSTGTLGTIARSGILAVYGGVTDESSPTTIINDTFTEGSDTNLTLHTSDTNTPGNAWETPSGAWQVSGANDNLEITSTSGDPWIAVKDSGVSNCTVYGTLTTSVVRNIGGGMAFRYTDANNYWYVTASDGGNSVQLRKVVEGVDSLVANNGRNIATNAVIPFEIVLNGSSISVSYTINGAGAGTLSATDAFNSTATRHGFWSVADQLVINTGNKFDSFSVDGPGYNSRVTFILSEPFADDCSSIEANIPAGLLNDGSVSNNENAALSISNASNTSDYPTIQASIVGVTDSNGDLLVNYSDVNGEFVVEVDALQAPYPSVLSGESAACVVVEVSDGTTTETVTVTSASRSAYNPSRFYDECVSKGVIDSDPFVKNGGGSFLFRAAFDTADFTGSTLTVKAAAYPTYGDADSVRDENSDPSGRAMTWTLHNSEASSLTTTEFFVDSRGSASLSVNLSADCDSGAFVVGDTSGAVAILRVDTASGSSTLSLSAQSSTVFTSGEALTVTNPDGTTATATLSGTPTWSGSDGNAGTTGAPFRRLAQALEEIQQGATGVAYSIRLKGDSEFAYYTLDRDTFESNVITTWATVQPDTGAAAGTIRVFSSPRSTATNCRVKRLRLLNLTVLVERNYAGDASRNTAIWFDGCNLTSLAGRRTSDTAGDPWYFGDWNVSGSGGAYYTDCQTGDWDHTGITANDLARNIVIKKADSDIVFASGWTMELYGEDNDSPDTTAHEDFIQRAFTSDLNIGVHNTVGMDIAMPQIFLSDDCVGWSICNMLAASSSTDDTEFSQIGNSGITHTVKSMFFAHLTFVNSRLWTRDGTGSDVEENIALAYSVVEGTNFSPGNQADKPWFNRLHNHLLDQNTTEPNVTGALADDPWVDGFGPDDPDPADGTTRDFRPNAGAAGANLRGRIPSGKRYTPGDLFGFAIANDGTGAIGALQGPVIEDITGQVQVDGTIRLVSIKSPGLWGSTITPDNTKITAVSQVTGGTRTYEVGSVTGAGTSTLQVILTPDPLIYSVAAGGAVTVTIDEGWLTDENGNTTAAYSGIADGDNSSTQEPSGGGGNATKGNFGIHTGIKIGV